MKITFASSCSISTDIVSNILSWLELLSRGVVSDLKKERWQVFVDRCHVIVQYINPDPNRFIILYFIKCISECKIIFVPYIHLNKREYLHWEQLWKQWVNLKTNCRHGFWKYSSSSPTTMNTNLGHYLTGEWPWYFVPHHRHTTPSYHIAF